MKNARAANPERRTTARFLVPSGVAGAMIVVSVGLKVWAPGAQGPSLPTALQDFVTLTLSIVVEALPFVILGALVSVAIRLYVPTRRIFERLPKPPAARRFCVSFLGMFMPVCECGNVPVARGLVVKGLSVSESTTFLLAAPIVNPVTLLATASAFRLDPSIVWIRLAGALLVANLVGGLIALHKDQMALISKGFYGTLCDLGGNGDHHHDDRRGHHHAPKRWQQGVEVFGKEVSLMLKVLCAGAMIAGLTQVFVPRDVLTSLGAHPVFSILAMIALAFVVSICANVDAFFALAYANTFTAGSIVAFLVFGPMVDIKMLAMMRTTYASHLLAVVTLVVALSSVLIGLVVNYAL